MSLYYKIKRVLNINFFFLQFRHPPKVFYCNICDRYRILIRTDKAIRHGSRCLTCHSTAHHRGLVGAINNHLNLKDLREVNVYEISAHGAIFNFFKKLQKKYNFFFYFSEFLDNWEEGRTYNGVRCENIERLTFKDNFFLLITSTGLMEHVENDINGFYEIYRVLKPDGYYIFTVPLSVQTKKTLERAKRRADGSINNILAPLYHGDPFRGASGVFTWRSYGADIVKKLTKIGFKANIELIFLKELNEAMPVVVAQKK